jgi:hypothetical protein
VAAEASGPGWSGGAHGQSSPQKPEIKRGRRRPQRPHIARPWRGRGRWAAMGAMRKMNSEGGNLSVGALE